MMRKRPIEKGEFINEASTKTIDESSGIKEDMHKYIKQIIWPIDNTHISPSLADGSNLTRTLTVSLKEYEWNSVERHVKALGVKKIDWIRHALFKLMQEEQIYCFTKQKTNV